MQDLWLEFLNKLENFDVGTLDGIDKLISNEVHRLGQKLKRAQEDDVKHDDEIEPKSNEFFIIHEESKTVGGIIGSIRMINVL